MSGIGAGITQAAAGTGAAERLASAEIARRTARPGESTRRTADDADALIVSPDAVARMQQSRNDSDQPSAQRERIEEEQRRRLDQRPDRATSPQAPPAQPQLDVSG
jgi:hypothetical protein